VTGATVRFGNKTQAEYLDCAPIRAQFFRENSVSVELAKLFILGFSMLVARRDPPFHVDAKDAAPLNPNVYPPPRASRMARVVTAMQLIGSLLAVPIGIASAYSFYRANFAPETTCQNLRSGIIALLDKSVDAGTRRMLVRRDVEEFEKNCAAVDPDATAAFKSLLAAEKTAAPVVAPAPAAAKVQHTETAPPKEAVRKPEPRPQVTAKPPAANPTPINPAPVAAAPAVSDSAKRDPAVSDTQWLDAVRQALVTRKSEPATPTPKPSDPRPTEAKPQPIPAPAVRPVPQETALPPSAARPMPQETAMPPARPAPQETALPPALVVPPAGVPATASPTTAPALPPPIAVAPPTVRQVDPDHPVPPEAIPDPVPPANVGGSKSEEQGQSRAGKWISNIPLLGPVIDNARR
jgi:hypothetical protein